MSDSVWPYRWQPNQALPSLGFSRQKNWSGLPFPSPMHESEKWKVKVKSLSRFQLFATPWTSAYQDPPSVGFSRQEYWSGWPLPSPVLSLGSSLPRLPWKLFTSPDYSQCSFILPQRDSFVLGLRVRHYYSVFPLAENSFNASQLVPWNNPSFSLRWS